MPASGALCRWQGRSLENEIAAANAVNRADDTGPSGLCQHAGRHCCAARLYAVENGLYKTDAIFVVYPSQRGGYSAQCVNGHRTKRSKQPFPVAWAGKPEEQLRKISGLGLRFCHPSRFLITADDKAAAIEACRRTLRPPAARSANDRHGNVRPRPSTAADRARPPPRRGPTCCAARTAACTAAGRMTCPPP